MGDPIPGGPEGFKVSPRDAIGRFGSPAVAAAGVGGCGNRKDVVEEARP